MAKGKRARIPRQHCVACGQCAKVCPRKAIHIIGGMYAEPDGSCVGCGMCEKACPAGIIVLEPLEGGAGR